MTDVSPGTIAADPPVRTSHDGHVAIVETCRPPNNVLDVDVLDQVVSAIEQLADNADIRAVVLCSQGKHFCAGIDLKGSGARSEHTGKHLYDVALRLFEQPLPLVAAVQGAAIGGGLGLALAADFRVGAADTQLSANFASLGLHQGFGLSVTLPAAAGLQTAQELLYTGRRVRGDEAHSLGLIDRFVASDQTREDALTLAAAIASGAPLAVRSMRATLRADLVGRVRAAIEHERAEQERLMQTDDFREAFRAIRDRRSPVFSGR